ncbi:MAG: acyltransferase [Candidatus Marinimicrobia bacterium]|jgi:maltose O-acetyltransferase|nr:acyltransferase [Candidatus Neomarinimicrobiota bacterium]MBT3936709.1 acyltransferase [Candidatus Neomarinimicrobiota bacterium]MBT3961461.1 acyltransferase [Candidatus Neomarinimicrobiota bacterium]MBT4382511.1 acyltransferase [Candidatus Neomarinimicrobiota bacterium]MBT4637030.1 acyltransferase [Candidatus Neomarinimicrobiota bacterium]
MIFLGRILYFLNKVKNKLIHSYLANKYSSSSKSIGINVRFNGISKITGLNNLDIGNNVHIGENAFFKAEGGLSIGDNTHFARNVVIYTHSHNYEGERLPYDDTFRFKKVSIGKNVWIGINVTILPGTTIGDGAIIGAGATISGQIAPMEVIGAKVGEKIKSRDKNHYENLESAKQYGAKNGQQYEK